MPGRVKSSRRVQQTQKSFSTLAASSFISFSNARQASKRSFNVNSMKAFMLWRRAPQVRFAERYWLSRLAHTRHPPAAQRGQREINSAAVLQ